MIRTTDYLDGSICSDDGCDGCGWLNHDSDERVMHFEDEMVSAANAFPTLASQPEIRAAKPRMRKFVMKSQKQRKADRAAEKEEDMEKTARELDAEAQQREGIEIRRKAADILIREATAEQQKDLDERLMQARRNLKQRLQEAKSSRCADAAQRHLVSKVRERYLFSGQSAHQEEEGASGAAEVEAQESRVPIPDPGQQAVDTFFATPVGQSTPGGASEQRGCGCCTYGGKFGFTTKH